MKRSRLIVAACVLFAAVVDGTFALTGPAEIPPEALTPTSAIPGEGVLDRAKFVGRAGTLENSTRSEHTFVFDNGLFVSKACERICDYPARPYLVRRRDAGIEFVSETRCPCKSSRIAWRRTVQ